MIFLLDTLMLIIIVYMVGVMLGSIKKSRRDKATTDNHNQ